jgi:hypothetical protein
MPLADFLARVEREARPPRLSFTAS